jgi:acetylglutamate kinase
MTPQPLVIKIGGTTLEEQRSNSSLWKLIAGMGNVVLLHGGGKAVDKVLAALGFETVRREGIRITPPEQMPHIAGVLAGSVNKALVGSINAAGGSAVGLCLGDGNAISCVKADQYAFDAGMVGRVVVSHQERNLLTLLLTHGYIPVVSSIGIDPEGRLLNINADDAAAGVAAAINARAVMLMTDVPGVLDEHKQLIPELTGSTAEVLIQRGVITGGMIPKVRAALAASRAAGTPVVVMDGNDPSALERSLRGESVGTRITA